MKKLMVVALLFMGFAVQAQEFSIGPKVGVNQGNIRVNGAGFESGDAQLGYHVGAFIRLGGNSLFVQPEVLFTNTGGEILANVNGDQVSLNASFNRLDVPFMVGFKLANFFRIQAGPVASFLIDGNIADAPADISFNNTTFGYQAGIGLDIGNMIIDFKYEGPFGRIAQGIEGFNTDQRQNQLILSVGFRLF